MNIGTVGRETDFSIIIDSICEQNSILRTNCNVIRESLFRLKTIHEEKSDAFSVAERPAPITIIERLNNEISDFRYLNNQLNHIAEELNNIC